MNKRTARVAAATAAMTVSVVVAGLASHGLAQTTAPAAPPAVSAAVVAQPARMQHMHASLVTYGDVLPGALESISSASPARIAKLNVIQGQSVRRGEVLAVLDSDPTVQLAYEQAQSARRLADAELARTLQLQKLQLATQSQVDTAARAQADAQAGVQAQEALGGGRHGMTIKAPADGVVVLLGSFQGDRVQPGAPFMQIGSSESLKVILGVDPADLGQVRRGMAVSLTGLSGSAHAVLSQVADVQNLVDPKTQLANVLVRLPAGSPLIPGTRVRGEIALERQSAYDVPRQAVLTDARGSYVFQVTAKAARRVAVRQVVDNGARLGVTGDIDPDQPIVVQGNYELADGMPVRETR